MIVRDHPPHVGETGGLFDCCAETTPLHVGGASTSTYKAQVIKSGRAAHSVEFYHSSFSRRERLGDCGE